MRWHTIKEAAPILGVSEEIVYRLCATRRIAHRRIGLKPGRGKIQISDTGIAEYLASCEVAVEEEAPQVVAPPTRRTRRRDKATDEPLTFLFPPKSRPA